MKRKYKKKTPRQKIIVKLDTIVSKIIRDRDGACVQCGSVDQMTNGHIFSRSHYATRWDVSEDGNCHCQCWSCNCKHEYNSWEYYRWYITKFGQEKFDELYARHHHVSKFKTFELEEMFKSLKTHTPKESHDMSIL